MKLKTTKNPITKDDLTNVLQNYPTKQDLKMEISALETRTDTKMEKLELKIDDKARKYRDEVLTVMDGLANDITRISTNKRAFTKNVCTN